MNQGRPHNLSLSTHRLTDLPRPKHPAKCQRCGAEHPVTLHRWQECDHNDEPENLVVVLCAVCSEEVIEQHPRLYMKLHKFAPWAGCMEICVTCKFRNGVSCTHPKAKANGGPGVEVAVGKPVVAMCAGTRHGKRVGWREVIWPHPPRSCGQFEKCNSPA